MHANFRPHPLFRGGHFQTLAGCYLPGPRVPERATQHRVDLPDGDQIVVHEDQPDSHALDNGHRHNRGKAVLLVHGLGGSHRSGCMLRSMHKLTSRGIHVFRMDLRGCGAGAKLARNPLHAGRSEDVSAALEFVLRRTVDSSVGLIGFSMGANMVLKLLAELGDLAPRRLIGGLAVSPPIDLAECCYNLHRGMGWLYDRAFVTGLMRAAAMRRRHVPDACQFPPAARPKRLLEYDELFTAPFGGFACADDYYQRASAGPLLTQITVPTVIVTAANDPIVPLRPFEKAAYSPATRLLVTPCGGHLGFIGVRGVDPDRRWLDWRIVDWVESLGVAATAARRAAAATVPT